MTQRNGGFAKASPPFFIIFVHHKLNIIRNEKNYLHIIICPYFRRSQRTGQICILFHRRWNGSQSSERHRNVCRRTPKRNNRRAAFIIYAISGGNRSDNLFRNQFSDGFCCGGNGAGDRKKDIQSRHFGRSGQKSDSDIGGKSQKGGEKSGRNHFGQRRSCHARCVLCPSARPEYVL